MTNYPYERWTHSYKLLTDEEYVELIQRAKEFLEGKNFISSKALGRALDVTAHRAGRILGRMKWKKYNKRCWERVKRKVEQ
jgi:hypothetical protein